MTCKNYFTLHYTWLVHVSIVDLINQSIINQSISNPFLYYSMWNGVKNSNTNNADNLPTPFIMLVLYLDNVYLLNI